MKPEDVKKLYLHSELVRCSVDDLKFIRKAVNSIPVLYHAGTAVAAIAFSARQAGSGISGSGINKGEINRRCKRSSIKAVGAHAIAFEASRLAAARTDPDKLVLPL